MSRRVLLICYYFPPLGLAGVGRPLNLFKRLPAHGYECDILTVKSVAYHAYEPELLEGLDVRKIFRSGSVDPQRLLYLAGVRKAHAPLRAASGMLKDRYFPDSKRGWVRFASALGKKLIERNKYDLLLSTSPPVSSHVVAMCLASGFGIKWVADFRDFWTTLPIKDSYERTESIERAQSLLEQIKTRASALTAVNSSIAEYLGTRHVISNGFEPEIAALWAPDPDRGRFLIGLLGTFDDSLPLRPLLQVVAEVRSASPELFERIQLLQVGRVDKNWLESQLNEFGLQDRCVTLGLRSRKETVQALSKSSVFYMGLALGTGDRITTARVYDLLASGRPILAYASPTGDLAQLLRSATGSMTFTDNTVRETADYLSKLITQHRDGILQFTSMPVYARPYSWDNIAAQFASLFEKIA